MQGLEKVSVIIPTYNRWPYLCDAIDSVLAQTYPNTECIVVDDYSDDGSYEKICEKYQNTIIVLRNKENREKSYSRNYGTRHSDAQYVCYLDSDDVLMPDAVEARMGVITEKKLTSGMVYGITQADSERKASLCQDLYRQINSVDDYLEDAHGLKTNSFLISRKEMLHFGMYNESLTNREDIELFLRLLCHLKLYFCATVVSVYRDVSDKRARDNWQKIIDQGYRFSEALRRDEKVRQVLGDKLIHIAVEEHRELLRALYRGKFYGQYRRDFIAGFKRKLPFVGLKYCRRYLISLFLAEHPVD